MEEEIQKIVKSLIGSRNKQIIYNNLTSLRSFVTNKQQFTIVLQQGGIRAVTGSLRLFPNNASIVNIGLSILGNCCTDRDCAKEVIKHSGIQILTDILKNWSSDSIICRTFRIIGNIAQFDNYASEIYKYGIVPIVVKVLNTSITREERIQEGSRIKENSKRISMATQDTAIRMLRILWTNCYSNRDYIVKDGAVRSVSLVLTKYTDVWKKKEYHESMKKEIERFLENVLKTLHFFSRIGTPECAKQILADGKGFKTLVALIHLKPYLAVRSLTNLSHVATSRSDIANTEAVRTIVTMLKEFIAKHPDDRYPSELVSAFCLFFKHPLNCSEVKKAGGLELILDMLRKCKSKRQEIMIIHALYIFHYDKKGQAILKDNGIVEISINCIERNLKSKTELNAPHRYIKRYVRRKSETNLLKEIDKKRLRDRSPSEESSSSSSPKFLRLSDPFMPFICGGRMTPESDSPLSSPSCTPPRKDVFEIEDSDNSENYSPLCSDFEDAEDEINLDKIPDELNQESDKESDNENITPINEDSGEEKVIHMLLCVLSRISYVKSSTPEVDLVSKRCITVLFKYVRECSRLSDKLQLLLGNIVSNPINLLSLIQHDIIMLIHNQTEKQHDLNCKICFNLHTTAQKLLDSISFVAESEFGKEQLINLIQKGSLQEKIKCCIIIPLIIKLKPMLLKIMDKLNGLNMLINNFAENSDLRYDISVSLSKLSRSIHINEPVIKYPQIIYTLEEKYKFNPEGKQILTIKLDDGSSLDVDREFLIQKADYFKMMLTGSFLESNQEVIRLKNVSNEALQCLLNLLKIDYQKMIPPPPLNIKLITILEVLALTDLYLLEKLTDWLSTCVLYNFLKVDTASEIYNWSITSGTNFLRVETVVFLLTAKMKDRERYDLLINIIDYGFLNEFKDDVQKLISRYLKIR